MLTRPVGRPPNEVRRSYANFTYQAGSWNKPRRVVAKVEWHPGELYPRVGFIVTNMARPAENVVAFYNKRGTCEQWIKEGKGAIKWTRLSCRSFAANAVRLQLHALAYNLGNFLRTLATQEPIKDWSLTSLKEKLIKIDARAVTHGRYVAFQMAEVAIPRNLFGDILRLMRNCARRLIQRLCEAFDCHAFERIPRESCVLMTGRSTTLGAGRAGHMKSDPSIYKGHGSALRGKSNGGKIGLRATPIWGMSVETVARADDAEKHLVALSSRDGPNEFVGGPG